MHFLLILVDPAVHQGLEGPHQGLGHGPIGHGVRSYLDEIGVFVRVVDEAELEEEGFSFHLG